MGKKNMHNELIISNWTAFGGGPVENSRDRELFKFVSFLIAPVFIIASLGVVIAASRGEISYVGSSTVGLFVREAAKVYTKIKFSINTELESAGGERAGLTGKADIGGVARDLIPFSISEGAVPTLIGMDAIAAIVNEKNPLKDLTKEQLKGIFTGKIRNWKKVGGRDSPIRVFIVDRRSATRGVFKKAVLGGEDYRGAEVVSPDARIVDIIAAHPNAIGQIGFAFFKGKNMKVRALSIDGQEASVDNPKYPVTRPLYLVTKGQPKGEVKDFIDWARSPEGQEVVKKTFIGYRSTIIGTQ